MSRQAGRGNWQIFQLLDRYRLDKRLEGKTQRLSHYREQPARALMPDYRQHKAALARAVDAHQG